LQFFSPPAVAVFVVVAVSPKVRRKDKDEKKASYKFMNGNQRIALGMRFVLVSLARKGRSQVFYKPKSEAWPSGAGDALRGLSSELVT
jgi:membrane protein implicated in regulation of membrane protease activity